MDFDIPQDMQDYLRELDDFIEQEIMPLQMQNDNNRFFRSSARRCTYGLGSRGIAQ